MTGAEKAIYDKLSEMDKKLQVSIEFQKEHNKRLDKIDVKVETLEAIHNQNLGKKALIATIFTLIGSVIGSIIAYFVKHSS